MRLGQTEYLEPVVQAIVDKVMVASLPTLKEIVAQSAQAAEPTIRTVVREEVMPKATLALVAGLVATGGLAALIGSFFATRNVKKAAGSGSSRMSSLEGITMTQKSVHSPPIRAKAANGNIVTELRESARELADELARKRAGAGMAGPYRPGFRSYAPDPSTGLGLARALVNGPTSPGAVVGGAIVGVPTQQIVSKALLQRVLGANEMVGDGVTGLAGIVLHLIARTSFTLGFGTSLLLPFVADLTDWALSQAGVTSPAGMQGVRPQHRIAAAAPQQRQIATLRQRIGAGSRVVA